MTSACLGKPGICPSPSTIIMSLTSPWTYLGSAPFAAIAERNGATVNIKPCKFGPIFEQTGGLPLPKRSPQRRAYRMMELKRWREVLGTPINLEPKHFPCDDAAATRLVIAAKLQGKDAHRLSLELGRARVGTRGDADRSRRDLVGRPARRSRRRGAARGRSFGRRTRRAAREVYAGGFGSGRLRRAELRVAFGRNLLGPGSAGTAGTRFEEAG